MNGYYILIGGIINIILLKICIPILDKNSDENTQNFYQSFPIISFFSVIQLILLIIILVIFPLFNYQYCGSFFTYKSLKFMFFFITFYNLILISTFLFEYNKSDKDFKKSNKILVKLYILFSLLSSIYLSSIFTFVLNGKIDNSSEGKLVLTTKIKGFDHYETYTKNGNIKHHYFIVLNENDFDITKLRVSFDIYDKLNKEDIINLNLKKGLFDIIYIKDIELVQKNSNTEKK